ncbi:alpha/beta fold hydrolase [Arsenicicoccus sp. oral taxon 190]|uniref:alpha/beta fold hydrolase n=1 Tax=Arsenicicoccus sp. oral taxon 190 TaxID=1658671 RepID=UPI00067A2F58|nr:alpha/beta hydrolase [Arsenicicoccus sp. oral taxon 190]AKT51220.1 hypothetical protein ADJ73_07670 [Arsenicicoccus sp. oral taxon 190]
MPPSMSPSTQHGTTTSADGTALAWTRQGSGPTVVLVEPVMTHRGYSALGELPAALARRLTVVTYDRRGRGESGGVDTHADDSYDPRREVEDLAALVAEHGGTAALYGFSSGATLALRAARDLGGTVTAVVATEPARDVDPDIRPELRRLVDAGRRVEAIRLFNRHIGIPEDVVAQLPTGPAEPSAHTITHDLTVIRETPVSSYGQIGCPVLVLLSQGSQEPLAGWARETAAVVPGAELRVLPGGWHGLEPGPLVEAVSEFLRR